MQGQQNREGHFCDGMRERSAYHRILRYPTGLITVNGWSFIYGYVMESNMLIRKVSSTGISKH